MDGIKTFRKRLGCNQQELADRLKISANTISQWESGTRKPSYEILKQLLELGATVEELFGIDCRGSCPHAQAEEPPDAMPQWARRMEARLEQLEQVRAKANAG